jgi:hypothetical protein
VLELVQGRRVTLTTDTRVKASSDFLAVNDPAITKFVQPGDDVFVGQYLFTGSETSSVYLKVGLSVCPHCTRCCFALATSPPPPSCTAVESS